MLSKPEQVSVPSLIMTVKSLIRRVPLFWWLQAGGWLVYLWANIAALASRGTLNNPQITRFVTATVGGFLVTIGLRYLYRRLPHKTLSFAGLTLAVLLISFLAANAMVWLTNLIRLLVHAPVEAMSGRTTLGYLQRMSWWVIPCLGWSAMYFAVKFWRDRAEEETRAARAAALAQSAQYQMLRYRLSPHFLFNTLNAIRALIGEDKRNAKVMLTELAEFLRYSLVGRNRAKVPLREEVEAVHRYLAIQKMRYESKVEFEFAIDPDSGELTVPSFLLHPLVENAVVHGLSGGALPLKILVRTAVEAGRLRLEVVNSGALTRPAPLHEPGAIRTGLDTVHRRLEEAFPGRHAFRLYEAGGAVHAEIEIGLPGPDAGTP